MLRGANTPQRRTRSHSAAGRRDLLGRILAAFVLLAATGWLAHPAGAADDPLVFAAASLTDALTEAAEAFTAETGITVRLSFAASSALARQIETGAPATVFVSANRQWIDHLESAGLIVATSRFDLAGNRLALIAPRGSDLPAGFAPAADLPDALGDGRLAVGDPDHVPAGQYARAALVAMGLWPELESRLARTGDVRGALALVARGEVPFGIVYATDAAIAEGVEIVALLPADAHPPIAYPAALTGAADDDARAFLAFLRRPAARAIFRARGFAPPPGVRLDPAS